MDDEETTEEHLQLDIMTAVQINQAEYKSILNLWIH
jgi:hypothetical protein